MEVSKYDVNVLGTPINVKRDSKLSEWRSENTRVSPSSIRLEWSVDEICRRTTFTPFKVYIENIFPFMSEGLFLDELPIQIDKIFGYCFKRK